MRGGSPGIRADGPGDGQDEVIGVQRGDDPTRARDRLIVHMQQPVIVAVVRAQVAGGRPDEV